MRYRPAIFVSVALVCNSILPSEIEAGGLAVVVHSGQRSPDQSGDIAEIENPVSQRPFEAVFSATVRENGFLQSTDLFRAGRLAGGVELLAKQGEPSPDGNGQLYSFAGVIPFVNQAGQFAFESALEKTLGGLIDSDTIFVGRGGSSPLKIVVRANQLIPGGNGDRFGLLVVPIGFNDSGEVAFTHTSQVEETYEMWRGAGSPGSLFKIVSQGDSTPDGDGFFAGSFIVPGNAVFNERGEAAFFDQSTVGGQTLQGVYRGKRFDSLVTIARKGRSTPSGNGTYSSFFLPPQIALNNQGQVAFVADLQGTSGGTANNQGIFRGNGATTVELARKGSDVPGGNGRFLSFRVSQIVLDELGEVLFRATVTGASGGSNEGIFLAGRNGIRTIARLNAAAPVGGTFSSFYQILALNDSGQAAFYARVNNGGPTSVPSLFFYESGALQKVAQAGDPIPGYGTLLNVVPTTGLEGLGQRENSLLNELGQVVFHFYATGGDGVAVWTPSSYLFSDGFESGSTSGWQ